MKVDNILKCPTCDSNTESLLIKKGSVECRQCKSIYKKNGSFYNLYIGEKVSEGFLLEEQEENVVTNEKFGTFVFNATLNQLKKELNHFKCSNILDLGCGNGAYANFLEGYYDKYYGLEPSDIPEKRLLKVEDGEISNTVLCHFSTNGSYPIQNNSVDVVSLIAVYDHIPDIKPSIIDAWNKVKKGGGMIVVMQNYDFWIKSIAKGIVNEKHLKHEDAHFRVHSPESLVRACPRSCQSC